MLPGVMPIIGRPKARPSDVLEHVQSWVSPTNALRLVSVRLGVDISGYPLDGPVPDLPLPSTANLRADAARQGRRENMTLRDLYNMPLLRAAIG